MFEGFLEVIFVEEDDTGNKPPEHGVVSDIGIEETFLEAGDGSVTARLLVTEREKRKRERQRRVAMLPSSTR